MRRSTMIMTSIGRSSRVGLQEAFAMTRVIIASSIALLALAHTARADFEVVVHSSNPIQTLSVSELSQFFLKRDTRWDGGATVEPVDQVAGPIRESFSLKAHGKSVDAIKRFWQRQIFSGRSTPPPELPSDAAVLSFVRARPWAIGYVSAETPIGDDIRVVPLSD